MALFGVAAIEGTLRPGTLPVLRSYEDFYAKQQAQEKINAEVAAALALPMNGYLDFHTVTVDRYGEASVTRWHAPYEFTAFTTPTVNSEPQTAYVSLSVAPGESMPTAYSPEAPGYVSRLDGLALGMLLHHFWGAQAERSFDIPGVGTASFTAENLTYPQPWEPHPAAAFSQGSEPVLNVGSAANGTYVWLVLGDGPAPAWPLSYAANGLGGPSDRIDGPPPEMPAFTPVPWPF